MGAFFILRRNGVADADAAIARVAECAAHMGLVNPVTFEHGGYHFCLYPKITAPGIFAFKRYANGDFAFSCGTLFHAGRIGIDAIDRLYEAWDDAAWPPSDCYGHFSFVIGRGGRVFVCGDAFGGYQIHYDMEQRSVSSSLLMIAAALPRLSFSLQGIYEYVFNGVVSGVETILREILRLPIGGRLELEESGFARERRIEPIPTSFEESSTEAHVAKVAAVLEDYFSAIAANFRDNVVSALSGGYDSRLLLALLRHHGIRPRLYVYGRRSDPDVELAERIAHGESLHLDIIDKGGDPGGVSEFPAIVERNYWVNDGFVWAGLFDNGMETAERRKRVLGGALAINGGGGEILRNFFYLPDRRYRPRQILWSFYSQYDPSICTGAFLAESYYRNLEDKIRTLIGEPVERLPRPTVEWLYHRFRCRSWDGKVDSDNNRFGHTALPFQESRLTRVASRVPLPMKNHGIFEALLISRFDRRLAAYPSAYGHDFASPPPLKRKIADYATMIRPTHLRRFIYRLKGRAGIRTDTAPASESYVAAVLPGRLDFVSRFFHLDRVVDPGQLNRILSLEYFARKLGTQLDPAVD